MLEWLEPEKQLNQRLANIVSLDQMPTTNLWSAQIEAIRNLEKSLAANKRRALIQMATGSGKTYTAVNFVYRLIKLAGARRILFLVDRGNLGDQTLKEFQQFVTPDDGRKFTELYNVQHLKSSQLDKVSRVCIELAGLATSFSTAEIEKHFANNFHVRHRRLFAQQKNELVLVRGSKRSRLLKKAHLLSETVTLNGKPPVKKITAEMRRVFGNFSGRHSFQRSPTRWVEPPYTQSAAAYIRSAE